MALTLTFLSTPTCLVKTVALLDIVGAPDKRIFGYLKCCLENMWQKSGLIKLLKSKLLNEALLTIILICVGFLGVRYYQEPLNFADVSIFCKKSAF